MKEKMEAERVLIAVQIQLQHIIEQIRYFAILVFKILCNKYQMKVEKINRITCSMYKSENLEATGLCVHILIHSLYE